MDKQRINGKFLCMLLKKFIFLFIFISSCGNENEYCYNKKPNFWVNDKSICVYTNNLDVRKWELNKFLDTIHNIWFDKFYNANKNILNKKYKGYATSIEFLKEYKYRGLASFNSHLSVSLLYQQCIANTALGHEMLHVLGYLYNINYHHDNNELFINESNFEQCFKYKNCEGIKNTLENKINIKLCNTFCPDIEQENNCFWWIF